MKKINSKLFKDMLIGGANNLSIRVEEINNLNVFPVPDGDTGTNMNITIQSAKKAILSIDANSSIEEIAAVFSRSSLLAASGNSGVIFSQFLKGISVGVQGKKELVEQDFVKIFSEAKDLAYKAVKNPVEGTILTLTKSLAEHAKTHDFKKIKKSKIPFKAFFAEVLDVVKATVANTPNLLPVLKEANVVDSGAFGLGLFIEGMIKVFKGEKIEAPKEKMNTAVIKHNFEEVGFCSEIIIRLADNDIEKFKKEKLEKAVDKFGSSTVVVHDEELVKVHIHTKTPGKLLDAGQKFGDLIKIKINNMQEQVDNNDIVDNLDKAIIAVSSGRGITKKFKELGVHKVIDGGQTANPSTQDFITAIENIKANEYFIFPNNKNIFMAAKQAKKDFKDKKIHIIETKTMWEGINCLMQFVSEDDSKEIKDSMKEVLNNTITIEITRAMKDTTYKNKKIKEKDYIAVRNGKIIFNTVTKPEIFRNIAIMFKEQDLEFAFVITGKKAMSQEVLITELENKDIDVEILDGKQPIYSFIVGGEK